LHSAFIKGQEIHRLVKVDIDGRGYFADVGNGWPSVELYPQDHEVSFRCFGMGFRTVYKGGRLQVLNERHGVERPQMEIPFAGKPGAEIRADIDARFTSGIDYPFSRELRFSQVVGERFLFLRHERLEIYSDHEPFQVFDEIKREDLRETLLKHFDFDLSVLTND